MSKHSPEPVLASELLTRFIFLPMHVNRKTGELKPSVFTHVHSKGCSIQRDSIARLDELIGFVSEFLNASHDRTWIGVICGRCDQVRDIRLDESTHRGLCVFDTAEPLNPAHGEICQSQYVIEEADRLELRRKLYAVFGDGAITSPEQYRDGAVWQQLQPELRSRRK